MIKFLRTYKEPIHYFVIGSLGTLMFEALLWNASHTNFGTVNKMVEVPQHDTFVESKKKLDDGHVPYIFSLNAVRYLINVK